MPQYKYFKYEGWESEDCPFSNEDIRSKFWWGEMMFEKNHQDLCYWQEQGNNWLKNADEEIKQLASKYSSDIFGVITYISCLFGKWCPMDHQEWIVEY